MNRLTPLAIVLAGAMIAFALAYGPRERIVTLGQGTYLVKDRWTGETWICRAGAPVTGLVKATAVCDQPEG